jgi:hypothetical protein
MPYIPRTIGPVNRKLGRVLPQSQYKERESEIIFFDKDPIAYAVSMYEYTPNDDNTYLIEYYAYENSKCKKKIVPAPLLKEYWSPKITPKHIAKAEEIRTHYKGKFLMMALGNNKLTEFRYKVLNYFKLVDYRMVDRNLLGMLSKLPRMFDEDKILDSIKEEFSVGTFSETELKSCSEFKISKTLTLIASHNKNNARHNGLRGEFTCYWFYDENNRVHLIELDIDNPFREHWTKMIQNPIDIKSQSYPHNGRDNMNYFVANKWELLE